jgi:undecaprenyl-diphosphatase
MNRVYQFDMSAFRAINVGWHSQTLDPVFWLLSVSGRGEVQFLFGLIFLLFERVRHFTVPLLLAILISGLPVVQGLKTLLPRDRPSNLSYAIVQENLFHSSFPSGHTTTSFAVAMMLVLLTWNSRWRWAGLLSLLWAGCVGLSRIYRGVHWPTDTIAGACCGIATSCAIWLAMQSLASRKPQPNP